nr:putative ribonuclease h protein [Quercus suber]
MPKFRNKPWRFEHMWLEEEGCRDTVELAWGVDVPGHEMARVEGKITHCQSKLKWWSRVAVGNITRLLKEKKDLLRKAEEEAIAGRSMNQASRIRAIPLCWTNQEDILIWPACKDENYSTKRGYQLFCKYEISGAASSSDSLEQSLFWKRIWKLHIPNKIKMFLWRVCSNALPTLVNLKKRKILEDAKCKACLMAEENTLHAIWDCEKLHHIWFPCFS